MLPISIACKTSSFVSLKKRIDLIYRAVLHKCSIFNSPNDTKQHKIFKKWDKRTVPYYVSVRELLADMRKQKIVDQRIYGITFMQY